jgi:hypothetical protein
MHYTYGGKNMTTEQARSEMEPDQFEEFIHNLEVRREMERD